MLVTLVGKERKLRVKGWGLRINGSNEEGLGMKGSGLGARVRVKG